MDFLSTVPYTLASPLSVPTTTTPHRNPIVESLRNEFSDMITQFKAMNPGQLRRLFEFVNPEIMDIDLGMMAKRIHQLLDEELKLLIDKASQTFPQVEVPRSCIDLEFSACAPAVNGKSMSNADKEDLQFIGLYHLMHLRKLVKQISQAQLMKLLEMIRLPKLLQLQLQILQATQQVLAILSVDTLANLHASISAISAQYPGTEGHQLTLLIQLPNEYFYLYDVLLAVLQLPLNELIVLHSFFPQWEYVQLIHLIRFTVVGLAEVNDIFSMLKGDEKKNGNQLTQPMHNIEILVHPPDRCVYHKNLNPIPTVAVNLGPSANYNFYVAPVLVRPDTGDEISKSLSGSAPVRVIPGRPVTFKNMKILTTSKLCGDTSFKLKFELRLYDEKCQNYEVVNSVLSNNIFVVSHVSLLAVKHTLPVVAEVIPFCAPTSGLTRVVILGDNFIESPTTRVKFDNIEVIPFFHGPKTLVCHVPQHKSGTVSVTVCNTPNVWSSTSAKFTFFDKNQGEKISNPFFNISNIKIEGDETNNNPTPKVPINNESENTFDELDFAFFIPSSQEFMPRFDQVEVVSGYY